MLSGVKGVHRREVFLLGRLVSSLLIIIYRRKTLVVEGQRIGG